MAPPSTTWTPLAPPFGSTSTVTSVSTSPVTGPTFITDSFSGEAAATLLSAHVGELGATWAKHPFVTGNVRISSGGSIYHAQGIDGSFYYASGVSGADYRVGATVHRLSTHPTGIADVLARCSTTTDTRYGARYSSITPGPGWSLYKVVSGTAAALGVASGETIAVGSSRSVILEVSGTSVRLYVDGVERVGATDASIALAGRAGVSLATVVGAQANGDNGLMLDNFFAKDLDSVSTTTTVTVTPGSSWGALSGANTPWANTSGASTAWVPLT